MIYISMQTSIYNNKVNANIHTIGTENNYDYIIIWNRFNSIQNGNEKEEKFLKIIYHVCLINIALK